MGPVRTRGSHGSRLSLPAGSAHALFCASVLLVQPTAVVFAAEAASPTDPTHAPESDQFHEPNAVLVSVTQSDLNRILKGTLQSLGGPVFEGTLRHPAKGVFDLQYWADISDPVLKLGADGEASVALSIREARVDVGRYERRIGKRIAYCENIGVRVESERPVDVTLGLRFAYEGGDLKILPDRMSIPDAAKRIHLIEPTHCEGTLMPRQLLWWIGKPALKHRLKDLDQILLASLKKSVARMNGGDGEGLLGNRWQPGAEASKRRDRGRNRNRPADVFVYPRVIDTSRESLFISLTASSSRSDVYSSVPPWTSSLSDRSYMALSEPFLTAIARYTFSRIAALPRKPGGRFAKLVKSDSLYSLVPGLRQFDGKPKVYFTFKTSDLPDVELGRVGAFGSLDDVPIEQTSRATAETDRAADGACCLPPGGGILGADDAHFGGPGEGGAFDDSGERAMIRVRVSGIEIDVWQAADGGDRWLGSLKVESGRVGLVPYANPLGGISFEIMENDWTVSSEGIEFNEDLFAATLQELVFGELFETQYAPLFRDGFGAGYVRLMPKTFRVVGDHLVIVFG
jgi:hypothetical protein